MAPLPVACLPGAVAVVTPSSFPTATRSCEPYRQALQAPQGDAVPPLGFIDSELEAGQADQCAQNDLGFEAGEGGAQAEMVATAEGQVVAGVGAGDVERLGISERGGVAVGRCEERDDLVALRNRSPTDLGVLPGRT